MHSAMLRLVFCFFFICTRVSGSGLSMPTKIYVTVSSLTLRAKHLL
jgi:hypothetical protein